MLNYIYIHEALVINTHVILNCIFKCICLQPRFRRQFRLILANHLFYISRTLPDLYTVSSILFFVYVVHYVNAFLQKSIFRNFPTPLLRYPILIPSSCDKAFTIILFNGIFSLRMNIVNE